MELRSKRGSIIHDEKGAVSLDTVDNRNVMWYNVKNRRRNTFMEGSFRRHDMSDAIWELPKPHTIGNKGTWGGNAKDTRQFLNGVFWILRTGAP